MSARPPRWRNAIEAERCGLAVDAVEYAARRRAARIVQRHSASIATILRLVSASAWRCRSADETAALLQRAGDALQGSCSIDVHAISDGLAGTATRATAIASTRRLDLHDWRANRS